MKVAKGIKVGKLCFCWYPNPYNDIELYYCKPVRIGEEYSVCDIFLGEEPEKLTPRGRFTDVCTADLMAL